jgi:transcriptional regulator with XRE-family HTH domain
MSELPAMTSPAQASQTAYWAEFIVQLRHELGWSQSRLAEALRTDQTTVSRWERALMTPRVSVRAELESLASQAGLLTLSQVAGFVKASPFPMILVDRNGRVVVASSVSGFSEGLGVKEQTPAEELETLDQFGHALAESDFWSRKSNRADYRFHAEDGPRQAVASPISIRGEVFMLVQKAH